MFIFSHGKTIGRYMCENCGSYGEKHYSNHYGNSNKTDYFGMSIKCFKCDWSQILPKALNIEAMNKDIEKLNKMLILK